MSELLDLLAHPGIGHVQVGGGIRERLDLLYGRAATLELEANEPRGFRARILMPVLPPVRSPLFAASDPGVHPT